MKILIIGLLVLISTLSVFAKQAEIMTCTSTEPFITYKFDPSDHTLTSTYYLDKPVIETLSSHAYFRSVNNEEYDGELGSSYEIYDSKTGLIIMKMILDGSGSDGMSNNTYPFNAKIDNRLIGCESTSAPAVNTFQAVDNLIN